MLHISVVDKQTWRQIGRRIYTSHFTHAVIAEFIRIKFGIGRDKNWEVTTRVEPRVLKVWIRNFRRGMPTSSSCFQKRHSSTVYTVENTYFIRISIANIWDGGTVRRKGRHLIVCSVAYFSDASVQQNVIMCSRMRRERARVLLPGLCGILHWKYTPHHLDSLEIVKSNRIRLAPYFKSGSMLQTLVAIYSCS